MMPISIHALLAESDLSRASRLRRLSPFLSTLSLRRATNNRKMIVSQVKISIHALLAESDKDSYLFYNLYQYFYPRSPCGERLIALLILPIRKQISIHALLAESDDILRYLFNGRFYFYPRSPCGERPPRGGDLHYLIPNFYPRSPCGERRHWQVGQKRFLQFLSTLSLRRATRCQASDISVKRISIHALLAESDRRPQGAPLGLPAFLSTLSLRRATISCA